MRRFHIALINGLRVTNTQPSTSGLGAFDVTEVGNGRRTEMRVMTWAAGVVVVVCLANAQTPYYGTRTVMVAVNQSWTDTGLDLAVGDRMIITASGTAAASAVVQGVPQWFGPDGVGDNCQDPYKPYPFAVNMLIGMIGQTGQAFAVGSFRGVNADTPGRLYLGMNDGFPSDGSGCFVAVIYLISCGSSAVAPEHDSSSANLKSYPNPIGPTATVVFALENGGLVDIRVYDSSGRQVRTIAAARFSPGSHAVAWDGRDDTGVDVLPGVYFYELRVDGQKAGSQKTIVLK